jgi:hypothetical protein
LWCLSSLCVVIESRAASAMTTVDGATVGDGMTMSLRTSWIGVSLDSMMTRKTTQLCKPRHENWLVC